MIYLNCFVIWDVSLLFWINYIEKYKITIILKKMCLSNFQSFGKETTEIQLDKITYLISPNGSGKTLNIRVLKPVRLQT